ncbi:MAG TPA: 1,4-dihydroxy-2-naphthoate polyprenyltransferase [Beutenbergiaceae bacterium]|nr:1,4-dihydroxy-2-naphthoate polyprenyltransferase [Beutenbergiaceae bacterium]
MSHTNTTPTLTDWLEGARLRTLPAAVAPVLAGTGAAGPNAHAGRAILAALVALALQIGVNFANDYSDGVRGTDEHRIGPPRLTASGVVPPGVVKRLAWGFFAAAGVFGLVLVIVSGTWWLLGAGAAAIAAAWFYTGGKSPYGYRGLGEVSVFVFFGLMATWATTYTQTHTLPLSSVFAGVSMGALACALLMINNIRDIPTDTKAGKRTLAVRVGERPARGLYAGFILTGIGSAVAAFTLLNSTHGATYATVAAAGVVIGIWGVALAIRVVTGSARMIPTLRDTGLVQLGIGIVIVLGGLT